MSQRLLIIEDDETLRVGLGNYFRKEGFEVQVAADGDTGKELLLRGEADLVLLDLMLPGPSGLELLRALRATDRQTPVLILTARGEDDDKVLGLELGADDYVTKPFSLREVAARVRAHLRRLQPEPGSARFRIGAAEVDLAAFQLKRGDRSHALSPKEVGMLELLHAAAGEVISRGRFLREVWGSDLHVSDRTIDTHILHLRQKLEDNPRQPRHLLTVHGAGYRLVLDTTSI